MNGVLGSLSGPPVAVDKSKGRRPLTPAVARSIGARVVQLLHSTGMSARDVHRVLAELPRSRTETVRLVGVLSDVPFGLEPEADDE